MSQLEKALSSLRPGVAWELPGEQILSAVIWPDGVLHPTQSEVDAEIARMELAENVSKRQKLASDALKGHLNSLAESWGYDSYISCIAYVGSPSAKYNAEGAAMLAYVSDCWSVSDQVRDGLLPEPVTLEEFMALMPLPPDRPTVL